MVEERHPLIFSVLIPSVPSRHVQACALFDKISQQAEGFDVEVLMLCDNKRRSVGLKREALVQISRGDYVAFVDDDDDVADDYIASIVPHAKRLAGSTVDVIIFDTLVTLNDGPDVICRHDLGFPNEQYNPAGFRRPPWQMHAWCGPLARTTPFPDLNCGEDWPWCEAMLKHVRGAYKIYRVLHHYRFSDKTTEASH